VKSGAGRWLRLILGLVFASLFVWLVLRRLNFAEVSRAIAAIPWPVLALAMLSLALGYGVRIIRWWLMLRAGDPRLRLTACVRPLLVSVAVNNVIPFRAGDALRVVGFRRQLAATPVRVFATLVAERVLDLTVLLAVFLVGVVGVRAGAIPHAYVRACVVIACLALLAWVVALLFAPRLRAFLLRACEHSALAARNWTQPAQKYVTQFLSALEVLRTPRLSLGLLALSGLVWICEGGVFALVASGLNYSGDPIGPWFAAATGTLATLIPSSPGYVGTFDFFTMQALVAYGATASVAGAFAVVVHTVLWLPLTITGFICFLLPSPAGSEAPALLVQREDPR
jgi:uncharacterized protein (TIRG00374 family)